MSISELITIIVASIGGSASLGLVIAWLAKSIISQFLTKDIAVFKEKLQMESQREMAQLKSSLEMIAFEHQVVFSRLHERRAEIIATLYSKIDDLYKVISDFVSRYPLTGDSSKDQNIKIILESVDNFRVFFSKHKIYFDARTCNIIVQFEEELSHACSRLVSFHKDKGIVDLSYGEEHKEWQKAMSLLNREVPQVKVMLETSFREILGVLRIKQDHKP